MASSARLDDRIRAILDTARSRLPLSSRSAIALTLVASILVALIIIIRPVARQADAEEQTKSELASNAGDEASNPADTSLNLDKGIIVKGMVLKPDGLPAIGATVRSAAHVYWQVDHETPLSETQTNDRGEFEIEIATRKIPSFEANVSARSKAKQRVFGAEFTLTATPSRAIEGLVVDAATKAPLSGLLVESYTLANYPISGRHELMSTTDGQGRFRLTGFPKGDGNVLMLKPNDEQPYLMREVKIPDSDGLDALKMTIELHRGIWIHGRVMNQLTQEPVVGARMYYLPWQSNSFVRKVPEFQDDGNADGDQARYQTDQNGNYRLVGLPGPAIIGAVSPLTKFRKGKDYELIATDAPRFGKSDELLTYRNPLNPSPSWPDAMLEIDPSSDAESIELNFELDRKM